jgi:hypothetical protein
MYAFPKSHWEGFVFVAIGLSSRFALGGSEHGGVVCFAVAVAFVSTLDSQRGNAVTR